VILRMPWRRGPVDPANGPVVVSATKFTYARFRDLPAVAVAASKLLRGWRRRPGAIGVAVGGEPWRRITYSVSAWADEEDLRRFIRAPDHMPLLRKYRPRLAASVSTVWRTDRLVPADAWREAMRRLAEAEA
jgi:hypothetical protein